MTCLATSNPMPCYANLSSGSGIKLRFGTREISVCKDFRKRFYPTNRVIECYAGSKAGHLEILLFQTWLIAFSRAQDFR